MIDEKTLFLLVVGPDVVHPNQYNPSLTSAGEEHLLSFGGLIPKYLTGALVGEAICLSKAARSLGFAVIKIMPALGMPRAVFVQEDRKGREVAKVINATGSHILLQNYVAISGGETLRTLASDGCPGNTLVVTSQERLLAIGVKEGDVPPSVAVFKMIIKKIPEAGAGSRFRIESFGNDHDGQTVKGGWVLD